MTTKSDREIQLTLPSNACCELFPENRHNSYRTQLRKALHLETLDWEVAVIDIQYPHRFTTLQRDIEVGICISYPVKNEENQDSAAAQTLTDEGYAMHKNGYEHWKGKQNAETTAYIRQKWIHVGRNVFINKQTIEEPTYCDVFKISKGYYENAGEVLEEFVQGIRKALARHIEEAFNLKLDLNVEYDQHTRKVSIQTKDLHAMLFSNDQAFFSEILGTDPEAHAFSENGTEKHVYFKYLPLLESRPSIIDTIHSIYIYCDVIKHQLVGDSEVRLLGVAPVKGERDSIAYWTFNPPYYIPIITPTIEDIEIQLNTEDGLAFPFTSNSKIVVRLHLRKRTGFGGGNMM